MEEVKALSWTLFPSNRQSFADKREQPPGSTEALLTIEKGQTGEMCRGSPSRVTIEFNHVRQSLEPDSKSVLCHLGAV